MTWRRSGSAGFNLRASAFEQWGDRPQALAELLAARGLAFVALSSGVVRTDVKYDASA